MGSGAATTRSPNAGQHRPLRPLLPSTAAFNIAILLLLVSSGVSAHGDHDHDGDADRPEPPESCELAVAHDSTPMEFGGCLNLAFHPDAARAEIQLYYTPDDERVAFAARSDRDGYLAIGFATEARMVPGWSVVAYVSEVEADDVAVGQAVVNVYNMSDQTPAGVVLMEDTEPFGVTDMSAVVDDETGHLTLMFSRPLDDGFTENLSPAEPRGLLWARGPNPGKDGPARLSKHFAHAASTSFALLPGPQHGITDHHEHPHEYSQLFIAHGMAQSLAWLFLVPAGVLIAQFSPRGDLVEPNPSWLQRHRALQITAVTITVVSFLVALISASATQIGHLLVGSLVMCFSSVQIVGGFMRPGPTAWDRPGWKIFHGSVGRLSLGLAWVNILLGLRLYGASLAYAVAAILVMLTLLIVVSVLSLQKKRQESLAASILLETTG